MRYKTEDICAPYIDFTVENGVVKNVVFTGGCVGNHKGIAALVEGMPVDEVIQKLQGITCGYRNTSCPDQLAQALIDYKEGLL